MPSEFSKLYCEITNSYIGFPSYFYLGQPSLQILDFLLFYCLSLLKKKKEEENKQPNKQKTVKMYE